MKKSSFYDTQHNVINNTNPPIPTTLAHSTQIPSAYSLQQQQQYLAAYQAQQHYRQQQLQAQAARQHKSSQSRNTNIPNTKPKVYPQSYLLDLMGNGNNNNNTNTNGTYYTQPQPQPQ
eukprot:452931_1